MFSFMVLGVMAACFMEAFSYTLDGVPEEMVWTRKQAETFFRQAYEEELQDCLESPRAMNALVDCFGWSYVVIEVLSAPDLEPWKVLN